MSESLSAVACSICSISSGLTNEHWIKMNNVGNETPVCVEIKGFDRFPHRS